jgi:hypothetical protein
MSNVSIVNLVMEEVPRRIACSIKATNLYCFRLAVPSHALRGSTVSLLL